jgi:hypothetical protein
VVFANAAEPPTKFLLAHGAIGGNAMPLWIAQGLAPVRASS